MHIIFFDINCLVHYDILYIVQRGNHIQTAEVEINQMRIGIDIDGVIIDSINYVAKELTQYLGREVKPDEVAHNLGKIDNINNIFEEKGEEFLCSLDPMELAVDSINSIAQEHDVYIISARFHNHYDITVKWLNRHGIKVNKIIFTQGKSKSNICKKKRIDVFVEDSVKNATELADIGIKVILYSTEYNLLVDRKDIIRCYDWTSIVKTIDQIMHSEEI